MRETTFSTKIAAEVAGASYRQVDYWCRTGALSPINNGAGSGNARSFTIDEIAVVAVLVELSNHGAQSDTWSTVAAWLSMPAEMWPDVVCVSSDGTIATGLRTGWLLDLGEIRDRVFDSVAARAVQE